MGEASEVAVSESLLSAVSPEVWVALAPLIPLLCGDAPDLSLEPDVSVSSFLSSEESFPAHPLIVNVNADRASMGDERGKRRMTEIEWGMAF